MNRSKTNRVTRVTLLRHCSARNVFPRELYASASPTSPNPNIPHFFGGLESQNMKRVIFRCGTCRHFHPEGEYGGWCSRCPWTEELIITGCADCTPRPSWLRRPLRWLVGHLDHDTHRAALARVLGPGKEVSL